MNDFSVAFKVVSNRHCPFYASGDLFVLTSQAVQVPVGYPSCLILVREISNLLFDTVVPAIGNGFEGLREEIYSCGGCTGLIKFQIEENPESLLPPDVPLPADTLVEKGEMNEGAGKQIVIPEGIVISGMLNEISPSELMQFFHMHQKTGKLVFDVAKGTGRIAFREGAIIGANYLEYEDKEAIFALLREQQGRFSFMGGIPPSLHEVEDIGDFMMLLMEGIKRMDEAEG